MLIKSSKLLSRMDWLRWRTTALEVVAVVSQPCLNIKLIKVSDIVTIAECVLHKRRVDWDTGVVEVPQPVHVPGSIEGVDLGNTSPEDTRGKDRVVVLPVLAAIVVVNRKGAVLKVVCNKCIVTSTAHLQAHINIDKGVVVHQIAADLVVKVHAIDRRVIVCNVAHVYERVPAHDVATADPTLPGLPARVERPGVRRLQAHTGKYIVFEETLEPAAHVPAPKDGLVRRVVDRVARNHQSHTRPQYATLVRALPASIMVDLHMRS